MFTAHTQTERRSSALRSPIPGRTGRPRLRGQRHQMGPLRRVAGRMAQGQRNLMRRDLVARSSRRLWAVHRHASSPQGMGRRAPRRALLDRSPTAGRRKNNPSPRVRDCLQRLRRLGSGQDDQDQHHARRLGADLRRARCRPAQHSRHGFAFPLPRRLPAGCGRPAQQRQPSQLAASRLAQVQWLVGSRKPCSPATPGAANAAGGPAQTTTIDGGAASTRPTPTADATGSYSAGPATSGHTPTPSKPARQATSCRPTTPSRGKHQSKP